MLKETVIVLGREAGPPALPLVRYGEKSFPTTFRDHTYFSRNNGLTPRSVSVLTHESRKEPPGIEKCRSQSGRKSSPEDCPGRGSHRGEITATILDARLRHEGLGPGRAGNPF